MLLPCGFVEKASQNIEKWGKKKKEEGRETNVDPHKNSPIGFPAFIADAREPRKKGGKKKKRRWNQILYERYYFPSLSLSGAKKRKKKEEKKKKGGERKRRSDHHPRKATWIFDFTLSISC